MTAAGTAPAFVVPASVAEATAGLAAVVESGGRALIVGGGTIVMPQLTRGEVEPTHVIDLGRLALDEIDVGPDRVRLGAMTSYQQLIGSETVAHDLPLLRLMSAGITGGVQIRTQGTIGGSIVLARPFSDAPTALVAHAGSITIASASGTRTVALPEFLLGAERPDLGPAELVTGLSFPRGRPDASYGYEKLKFAESSWPVVTAACVLRPADSVAITLGGVATVPRTISLAVGSQLPAVADVHDAVQQDVASLPAQDLWEDLRADGAYRRRVAPAVAARAYRRALARSRAGKDSER